MAFSVLLLFGLIFLGGVIGLVMLLTSPATRAVAGALLSVLGVLVALVVLAGGFLVAFRSVDVPSPGRQRVRVAAIEAQSEKIESRSPIVAESEEPGVASPDAERAADTKPATKPAAETEPSTESAPAAEAGVPPDWLKGKSRWTARDGASYWMRVRVGPYPREESGLLGELPLPRKIEGFELRQMLDRDSLLRALFEDATNRAVAQYTELLSPDPPAHVELPPHAVLTMLVSDAWLSAAPTPDVIPLESSESYGELVDLHVLLKFDTAAREQIAAMCRQKVVETRLMDTGGCFAILLILLGLLLAYLKIDLATAGAYRGRLRIAMVAVILIGAVALLLTA